MGILALRSFLRNKLAVAGAVIIVLVSVVAAAAPVIAPKDPTFQDLLATLASPSWDHLLGTDVLGRDTLSRLIHGSRTSLTVGVVAQVIVLAIGVPVGIVSGFAGHRVDNLIMRAVDIVYAFPDLLLIILMRAVFGGGVYMMMIAIGLASWPTIARLARAQALTLKERDFVMAAQATGAGPSHIILRHLLPNAMGPIVVAATFMVPRAIFAEAALGFIGIGVTPPTPSWGVMVKDGYDVLFAANEPLIFPAVAVALLMMSFTFLGDGLRDLLDPRTR